jgi:hypothetical protein
MEALAAEIVANDTNYEIFFFFSNFNGVYTHVTRKADTFSYEGHNFPFN